MRSTTFVSMSKSYDLSLFPSPPGKKYPAICLVHGNAGLKPPFGDQILGFAKDLSNLGYFTTVPKYYADNSPHYLDKTPHEQTLSDAILEIAKQPEVDPTRIGLIGFSLGATTSMTYIVGNPVGTVKVFVDFFGFLTPLIRSDVSHFPPTIILHNKNDRLFVPVQNSLDLDTLLNAATIEHSLVPPYDEIWEDGGNHSFKPGGPADINSRAKATAWIVKHLPSVGI
jgi:carboxymethylenebutenolidase